VILILDVISTQKPAVTRQTFQQDGGSIGRQAENSWVLPHSKVSGHHARVSYHDGTFYIEDTSRNGVFLNSSRNRLERGRPTPLTSGDRLLIDPYEIRVAIERDDDVASRAPEEPSGVSVPRGGYGVSNPFDSDDPFAPRPDSMLLDSSDASTAPDELDPLALLNLGPAEQVSPANAPNAKDLDRGLGLDAHFKPPVVLSPEPAPPPAPAPRSNLSDPNFIPHDYDPLAPDEPSSSSIRPAAPVASRPAVAPPSSAPAPVQAPAGAQLPPRVEVPVPLRPAAPRPRPADQSVSIDLAAVLEGAGIDPAGLTPELARTFGQILRVVVTGVMDVMRSRQQIKDEFRLPMTRFRVAENNPLKFSANVDDALHNLLVKRNPAYLGAVDAFEDAFDDLRNHQIAMLAGMRVAFESMFAEFDPDRLQQEFDRQKGLVPGKLRYWDQYRERLGGMIKDREATFRRLFGEEFARAYEEQLKELKARAEGVARPPSPRPPEE